MRMMCFSHAKPFVVKWSALRSRDTVKARKEPVDSFGSSQRLSVTHVCLRLSGLALKLPKVQIMLSEVHR